jgi:ActR/RegA family two-component response regulator
MNFTIGVDDGAEGLKWLSEVLTIDPQAVVVLVTAHSGVELAVQAMKQGAADFVTKPWENERLGGNALGCRQSCAGRASRPWSCASEIADSQPPPEPTSK